MTFQDLIKYYSDLVNQELGEDSNFFSFHPGETPDGVYSILSTRLKFQPEYNDYGREQEDRFGFGISTIITQTCVPGDFILRRMDDKSRITNKTQKCDIITNIKDPKSDKIIRAKLGEMVNDLKALIPNHLRNKNDFYYYRRLCRCEG